MTLHFVFPSFDHAADFAKAVPYNAQQEHHEVAVFLDKPHLAFSASTPVATVKRIAENFFGLEVSK